jgi:pimeloyl-ACP methyl ester carboxylesterase
MNSADYSRFCAESATWQTRQIQVDENISLRVITFQPFLPTNNPVVVFVPGWISLASTWKSVLLDMSRDFTIHYIETREKKTAIVRGRVKYRVEDSARDLAAIVEQLNLENNNYILCGSSLGATAIIDGFRFMQKRPLFLALIGVNAEFYIPRGWIGFVRCFPPTLYLAFKPVIKWYLRNFRLDVEKDQAQYRKYCDNVDNADPFKLKKAALALAKYKIWERLPEIQAPVLLFSASHDALHDLENIKLINELLPDSHYFDLETNSRTHSPEMVKIMREFTSGLRASRV